MSNKNDIPKLTAKQTKFAKIFVECGNASEAYRKSYSASKMKPESIHRKAAEVLENVKVSAMVSRLKSEVDRENLYELDSVLKGFGQIAFANIIDIFDFIEEPTGSKIILKGGATKLSELPREITSCIQMLKQTKDGIEVKLYSKDNALAQIARMKGYYAADKLDVQVESTLADLLSPSSKK